MSESIGGAGLIRITTVTAYVVAVLLSVVPTGGYFAMSRAELRFAMEKEVIAGASLVTGAIQKSQEPMDLQSTDFAALLGQRPASGTREIRRILGATGATIAESKDAIGIWHMTATSPIFGTNGPLGAFEVTRSLTEIIGDVVGVAIASLWFATWSFLFLRILPNRALKNALKEAIDSREAANSATLARDKAQEAARIRSIFLANMGHELRTPLNGVIGMIDLVADTELDPEQQSYIALAATSGRDLLTIVNDILDFSKLDEGKIEIVAVSFVVNELLMQTTEVFRAEAQKKDIQLEYELDPGLPELVVADPVRIRQILVSLIDNALKFTKTGKVTVTARNQIKDQTPYVEFVVADTGIGITVDQLENIFLPFTQVDESATRLQGGTGLGLAISLKLAKVMDGQVWATSEVGRGSEFHFILPLVEGTSCVT
ncbi:MAG: ATP-binding protein [Burkholderiales bacterium]